MTMRFQKALTCTDTTGSETIRSGPRICPIDPKAGAQGSVWPSIQSSKQVVHALQAMTQALVRNCKLSKQRKFWWQKQAKNNASWHIPEGPGIQYPMPQPSYTMLWWGGNEKEQWSCQLGRCHCAFPESLLQIMQNWSRKRKSPKESKQESAI